MTRRRSPRELERAVEDLESVAGGAGIDVVFRDDGTGDLVDSDGEPTEPNPDAEQVVIINETVVQTPYSAEDGDDVGRRGGPGRDASGP